MNTCGWHGWQTQDSLLEPRCVCARCDTVLTHKKKRNSARSRSDNVEVCESGHVVIGVRNVQCHHAIMDNCAHVVIGVRVMHCHHAFMANSKFSTCGPNFILVPIQLVVRLYELIVTFPCSHFLHTFAPRKHVIWGVVLTPPVGYSRPPSAVNDPSVTK